MIISQWVWYLVVYLKILRVNSNHAKIIGSNNLQNCILEIAGFKFNYKTDASI